MEAHPAPLTVSVRRTGLLAVMIASFQISLIYLVPFSSIIIMSSLHLLDWQRFNSLDQSPPIETFLEFKDLNTSLIQATSQKENINILNLIYRYFE